MADVNLGGVMMEIKANCAGLAEGARQFETLMDQMVKTGDKAGKTLENQFSGVAGAQKRQTTQLTGQLDQTTAAYTLLTGAAGKAFSMIQSAINTGIDAANRYKAAVTGMNSVGTAKGYGAEELEQAANGLTDAFLSTANASTALKNLLSRGYGLEEAVTIVSRLKDASAFGRQASLSLGEAVVTATEGLKNENSVLVDNAGVTKNVAKMWEDYAKAQGISTASMTQAQKIQAEYNGIMEETSAQVGDLAKLQNSLAGSQAQTANQATLLATAFGEALSPLEQAKTELVGGLLSGLTEIADTCPDVTAGVTAMTQSFLGMLALVSVISLIKKLGSALSLTSPTMLALAGIAAAIGVVAGAYSRYQEQQEALIRAEQERQQGIRDTAKAEQDKLNRLDALEKRYKELSDREYLTRSEANEMADMQSELASAYGIATGSIDTLTGSYENLAAAIKAAREAQAGSALEAAKAAAQLAMQNYVDDEMVKSRKAALETLESYTEAEIENARKLLTDILGDSSLSAGQRKDALDLFDLVPLGESVHVLQQYKSTVNDSSAALDLFNAKLTEQALAASQAGETINNDLLLSLAKYADLSKAPADDESNYIDQRLVAPIIDMAKDPELAAAYEQLSEYGEKLSKGLFTQEDMAGLEQASDAFFGEGSAIMKYAEAIATVDGVLDEAKFTEVLKSLSPIDYGVTASVVEFAQTLLDTSIVSDEAGDKISGFQDSVAALDRQVKNLTSLKKNVDTFKDAKKAYDAAKKSSGDVTTAYKSMTAAAKTLNLAMDASCESITDMDAQAEAAGKQVDAMASGVEETGGDIRAQLEEALDSAITFYNELAASHGMGGVDNSAPMAAISAVIAALQTMLNMMNAGGIAVGGGGGGGGGGGKKKTAYEKAIEDLEHLQKTSEMAEKQELEALERIAQSVSRKAEEELDLQERLYAAREALREKQIEDAYDEVSHLKHMGELTLENELAMLDAIAQAYALNAEERIAWEERVYDANQAIRERDIASIDRLAQGVISALQTRYEEMQEQELSVLDESREAWQKWADENTEAIQRQIDALDALSKTRDNEKKDAEELRKIAKLRQQIEYEQDEFNRYKLQQQLDAAIESRESRLSKLALQEQKDALQAQIEAVRDTAEKEQAAIDEEQEAVQKRYSEQLKQAQLNAEAQRVLLEDSQDTLLTLLRDYAPDYDALGQTLGERLLEGFESRVQGIGDWFAQFNASLTLAQREFSAVANQTAAAVYQGYQLRDEGAQTVNVEQNTTFTMPVATPGEVARRIAQANEELGLIIQQNL